MENETKIKQTKQFFDPKMLLTFLNISNHPRKATMPETKFEAIRKFSVHFVRSTSIQP